MAECSLWMVAARRVVITGPPPVQILDVAGPLEVFSKAEGYDVTIGTPVRNARCKPVGELRSRTPCQSARSMA
ncbi:MAG: hypothetical protein ACRD6B_05485 [Bryobacteraceae bacterium]